MTELLIALFVITHVVWMGMLIHFDDPSAKLPRPWDDN